MTNPTERDALIAFLHRRNEFDYDECQHGTYLGGPSNGEPYAMCERQADAVLAWMRENGYEKREPVTGPAYIGNMPPIPESDRAWFTIYCRECKTEEGMARHPEAQMLVDRRDAHNRWHAAHPVVDDAMADRLIDIVWSSPNRIAARAALRAALTPDGQERNE